MNWYSEISQIFLCPSVISITYCSSLPFLSLSDTLFFSLSLHSPHTHSPSFPHSFLSRSNELCDSHNTHTLNWGVKGELSEDDLSTVYKRLRTMSSHPSEDDLGSLLHHCSCDCCSRRIPVSSFPLPFPPDLWSEIDLWSLLPSDISYGNLNTGKGEEFPGLQLVFSMEVWRNWIISMILCRWRSINGPRYSKRDEDHLHKILQKFGKVYGYKEGVRNVLVTSDLDMINEVFVKQFDSFYARRVRFF